MIKYLFESFTRNEFHTTIYPEACDVMKSLILRNMSTALQQPVLFYGQNLSQQIIDIFRVTEEENLSLCSDFLSLSILQALKDDTDANESLKSVTSILNNSFAECLRTIKKATMVNLEKWVIPFLLTFVDKANGQIMAPILLQYTTPMGVEGVKYAESILGQLLCLSICPKNNNGPFEYYENLQNTNVQSLSNLSSTLWSYLSMHLDAVHKIFKGFLLIGGSVKDNILDWIASKHKYF